MANEITVRQWKENYLKGMYNYEDCMCDAGWYDWFCKDKALVGRLKKFGAIIKKIDNDFILDNYYIWFKNNCPCWGPLYDDMRFEPLDESLRSRLYFGVQVDCCRNDKKFGIFQAKEDYKTTVFFDTSKEVVDWINNFKG